VGDSSIARYSADFIPQKRFTTDFDTVGLWHFDETEGTTAADSSSNSLNGTLNGGVTWVAECAKGPVIIDEIGVGDGNYAATNRMRGNLYSVSLTRTVTEIETYLSFTGDATIYFDIFEASTINGTYYHKISYTVPMTMTGPAFYSSGAISFDLKEGKFYYIGARWGEQSITFYYDGNTGNSYPTSFGQWEKGLTINTTTLPDNFTYTSNVVDYTYYQRITTE